MNEDMNEWVADAVTTHHGITFHVEIFADPDSTPDEESGHSEEEIARWRAGEWRYVRVAVTPLVDGVRVENATFDPEEIEYGTIRGVEIGTRDIVKRAIEDGFTAKAIETLRKVNAQIADVLGLWDSGVRP